MHVRAEGRNASDAMLTALRAVAPAAAAFGTYEGTSTTPVDELLA